MPNYCRYGFYRSQHSGAATVQHILVLPITAQLEQLGSKCTLVVIVMKRKEPYSVSLVRFFSLPSATKARQLRLKIPQCGGGTAPKDPLIHSMCRTITNNRSVHVCVRVSNSDGGGSLKMENVRGHCPTEFTDSTHTHTKWSPTVVGSYGEEVAFRRFCERVHMCVRQCILQNSRDCMMVAKSPRFCPLKVGWLCPVSWL